MPVIPFSSAPRIVDVGRETQEQRDAEDARRYREKSDAKLKELMETPVRRLDPKGGTSLVNPPARVTDGWKVNDPGVETPNPYLESGTPDMRGFVPDEGDPLWNQFEQDRLRKADPSERQDWASGDSAMGTGGPENPATGLTADDIARIKAYRAERDAGQSDTRMRQTIGGLERSPDEVARTIELSEKTGANRLEVQENLKTFEKSDVMSRVESLRQTAPKLRSWLDDPVNLEVAHDDADNLGWWEQTQQFFSTGKLSPERVGKSLEVGFGAQLQEALWGLDRMLGESNAAIYKALPDWVPGKFDLANEQVQRALTADMQASAWGKQKAAEMPVGETWLERGVYGAAGSAPSTVIAAIATVATRNPGIGAGMMGGTTAGTAYQEARESGKSFDDALRYGLTQGGIETATEFIPLKFLLGDLAKDTPFAKMFFRQAAAEGLSEQAATFLQDASTYIELNPDKTLAEFWAERPNAALETLVASTIMSGVQTTVAQGMQAAGDQIDKNAKQKRAEEYGRFIEAMGDNAANSKLLKRLPDKYREAVAAATKDGPRETVYIHPDAMQSLAQTTGKSMEELAQAFRIDPNEIVTATDTGEFIPVPIGNYAAVVQTAKKDIGVSGETIYSALQNDIKFGKGDTDFTLNEIKEDQALRVAEREAAAKMAETDVAFADSMDRFRASILEEVKATGLYTEQHAAVEADMIASIFASIPQNTGEDIEAFWKANGARIVGALTGQQEQVDEGTLSQSVPRSPQPASDFELKWAAEDLEAKQFEAWKGAREGLSNEAIADRMNEVEPDAVATAKDVSKWLQLARRQGYDAEKAAKHIKAPETERIIELRARGLKNPEIAARVYPEVDTPSALNRVKALASKNKAKIEERKAALAGATSLAQTTTPKLPMDEGSRMARAREMGFDVDTPLFHGTVKQGLNDTVDIEAFDPEKIGDRWAQDKKGFFFTSDPSEASYYARTGTPGDTEGAVYPVFARTKKPMRVSTPADEDNTSFWDSFNDELVSRAEAQGADSIILTDAAGKKLVVVFDPKNIRGKFATFDPAQEGSSKLLAQEQTLGGTFTPPRNGSSSVIALFGSRSFSTLSHEGAHWYLDTIYRMARMENPHPFIVKQWASILEWAGKSPSWDAMFQPDGMTFTPEATKMQELFAESFEVYVMTAKAPSTAMRSVFATMKQWFLQAYKALRQGLGNAIRSVGVFMPEKIAAHEAQLGRRMTDAELVEFVVPDEIRQVFDRMIAAEDAIAGAQGVMMRDSEALAKAMLDRSDPEKKWPDKRREKYLDKLRERYAQARERAEADLTARLIDEHMRTKTVAWNEEKRDVRREVASEIDEKPEQRAYQALTGIWRDTRETAAEEAAAQAEAMLALAQADGYLGSDIGEAFGWVQASRRGLPMDKASRLARAKAQGFDTTTPLYHGSNSSFSAFRARITDLDAITGRSLAQTVAPRQLDATGFYSALREAVANSPQNKASAAQWKATLSKMPGVKAEEIEWTGVNDWLDAIEKDGMMRMPNADGGFDLVERKAGAITREELLGFLSSNGVRVEEVQKGERGKPRFLNTYGSDDRLSKIVSQAAQGMSASRNSRDELIEILANDGDFYDRMKRIYSELFSEVDGDAYALAADVVETLDPDWLNAATQFDEYALSGGDNYTELLLTLPAIKGPATHWEENNVVAHARFKTRYAPVPTTEQEEADNRAWNDAQPAVDLLRDEVRALTAQRARELQEGGYAYDREPPSTPSLAPLQLTVDKLRAVEAALPKPIDRNRRQKVLALEEIQSDWHQNGRKEGYEQAVDPAKAEEMRLAKDKAEGEYVGAQNALVSWFAKLGRDDLRTVLSETYGQALSEARMDEYVETIAASGSVQGLPNVQDSFRMQIPMALGRLADPIITDGEFKGKPGLKKLIDEHRAADLRRAEANQAYYNAVYPGGIPRAPFANNGWVNLVLKRMIRYAAENGYDQLAWIPGSVQNGNEVATDDNRADFYDKIVPNAANKIGRKYGAEVKDVSIKASSHPAASTFTWHSLPITPQLKAVAIEGFPLFHTRPGVATTTPPVSIPPMRLNLQAVLDQYGEKALAELPPEVAAYARQASDVEAYVELARNIRSTLAKKRPKSLWKFLSTARKIGSGNDAISYRGIRDTDGELLKIIGERKEAAGLIAKKEGDGKRSRSYDIEQAATAAWEAGYFSGESPPGPSEFIDAIRADLDGTAPLYARDEVGDVQAIKNAEQWEAWFDQNEMDIRGPVADLRAKLAIVATAQGSNAITPDEAAEVFNAHFKQPLFKTGLDLLQALKEGPQRDKLIRDLTDKRMVEMYGDVFRDGTIMAEAQAYARNEIQHRQFEIELDALAQAAGKGASANLAKQQAIENLRSKQVREVLNYNQWLTLERRWGEKAASAAAKGDMAKAAEFARYRLINSHMYTEGKKLAEQIEKTRKHLLKYEGKTQMARLFAAGKDYADQMRGLLSDYQLRNESRKAENKRAARAVWLKTQMTGIDPFAAYADPTLSAEDQQAKAAEAIERSALLRRLEEGVEAANYKSITVDELLAVRDEADLIYRLATVKNRLIRDGERRRVSLAGEDIAEEIEANQPNAKPAEPLETDVPGVKNKSALQMYFAMHRTLQSLAHQFAGGKEGGVFWRYIVRPLNEAFTRLTTLRKQMGEDVAGLFGVYTAAEQDRFYRDRRHFAGINRSLTTQGRLAIALNWGNEKNRRRIMDAYGWDEAQVQEVLNSLDKRDWDWVQSVWDYLDTWFPEANRVHEAVHGMPMDKVEPMQVATRFGVYKGGYYPIKYDPRTSSKAGQRAMEADSKAQTGRVGVRTKEGFTKKRVEGKVTMPLRLSALDVIVQHLDEVAKSIATEETLFDVGRILKQKAVEDAIVSRHGRQIYKTIIAQVVTAKFGMDGTSGLLAHLRNGATVVGLSWKVATASLQILGASNSVVRVGGSWIAKGYAKAGTGGVPLYTAARDAMRKSDFMRNRRQNQSPEMASLLDAIKTKWTPDFIARVIPRQVRGMHNFMVRNGFALMANVQFASVDVPTWWGAYFKAQSTGASEAVSVAMADQAVVDAQGGGEIHQLAAMQSGAGVKYGALLRILTNFMSYMITTYNLGTQRVRNARTPQQIMALGFDLIILAAVPVAGKMALDLITRGIGEDDEPEEWAERYAREQIAFLFGPLVGVSQFAGSVRGDDAYAYKGPAGLQIFDEMNKLGAAVAEADFDESFWRPANRAAGMILHYPAGQVDASVRGALAYFNGETDNPAAFLYGPTPAN